MNERRRAAIRAALIALLRNSSYGSNQHELLRANVELCKAFDLPTRHSQSNEAVGGLIGKIEGLTL